MIDFSSWILIQECLNLLNPPLLVEGALLTESYFNEARVEDLPELLKNNDQNEFFSIIYKPIKSAIIQYFIKKNIPCLGVEPTASTARFARDKGVEVIEEFFGQRLARTLKKFDLILGNNVLAHVPDINDFVSGLKIGLKPEGTITMEFPHVLNLLKFDQFDTIYHEHFSYFSLMVVRQIFAEHDLKILDVEQIPNLGGSLRLFVAHDDDPRVVNLESLGFYGEEAYSGLDSLHTYDKFAKSVARVKDELLTFLLQARRDGKTVAGYGAPAKATVLLNYCGIGTDLLPYTVDTTPYKQGKFIPGTGQTIYHPEVLPKERPDYLLIFPWNLKKEIIENISAQVHEWGGKFVTAIPRLEVVDA